MARNEEKHFCKLNRMVLLKEIEEYNKAHPSRPKLDSLHDPQEIINWLPSIKKDIDFYLKKSQVTCYSDTHVEDCMKQVVHLEKEFKAFVRKIKKLTPSPLDAVPWTNRAYKRKNRDPPEESFSKNFKRIPTPILDDEKTNPRTLSSGGVNWNLIDEPLEFSPLPMKEMEINSKKINANTEIFHLENSILHSTNQLHPSERLTHTKQFGKDDNRKNQLDTVKEIEIFENYNTENSSTEYNNQHSEPETRTSENIKNNIFNDKDKEQANQVNQFCKLVNYDSSDNESSG